MKANCLSYLKNSVAGITAALLLSACTLGPDYQRTESNLPGQYQGSDAENVTLSSQSPWWQLFSDATLNDLVSQALVQNYDLQAAVARVEEAYSVFRETRAEQFPAVDAEANSQRQQISENVFNGFNTGPYNNHTLQLSAAFELDFWGKLRRASEAARAEALQSEYARNVVAITLVNAVVESYLTLRSLDAQISVSDETVAARAESLQIAEARYRGGLSGDLDVAQAKGALADVEAQIADLRRQRVEVLHRLMTLTGDAGLSVAAGDIRSMPIPPIPPAGLPSELLNARPDIQAAEQQLIAANARIGVAKAAFLPTISLTGAFGEQSEDLSDLFSSGSTIWQAGLGLKLPIFSAGKYSAGVKKATAQQKQALAAYQQSILNGFAEVRNALSAIEQFGIREAALSRQRAAAVEALRLARVRYDGGYSPYLEVLDAQRTANTATLAFLQNRQDRLIAAVDLFTALGTGWSESPSPENKQY